MNTDTRTSMQPSRRPGRLPRPGRRASTAGAMLLAVSSAMLAPAAPQADRDSRDVDGTRAALERWVETRRIIAQQQRDWILGRELLKERIELVDAELNTVWDRIDEAEDSIADADRQRAELVIRNDTLKSTSDALLGTIERLETRTRDLVRRLPDPIRERVRPLSQRLAEGPEPSRATLAERFQDVVGILNEVDKFNRDITVTSELRTLEDGSTAEVTAMYVGIGKGYYVDGTSTVAGVGTATPDGWAWTPSNESAPEIARAIAILKNEQAASFVHLPMRIE